MSHFRHSLEAARATFDSLAACEDAVVRASGVVLEALTSGRKLMLCGNGGSASDSAHISTEFVCRFIGDRRPYPAMALGVDGGLLTAIGNDYEFGDAFARQVRAFGQPGDALIAISTSGKSRNILSAIEEARRRGDHPVPVQDDVDDQRRGEPEADPLVRRLAEDGRIRDHQEGQADDDVEHEVGAGAHAVPRGCASQ